MASVSNYTGNAGLGFGSSPGIPVTGGADALKHINDISNQIMLLDNQKNVRLYQQQIQDRNGLTNLILQNQVPPGELDPQYQGVYNEAKKRADDAFMQWKGNFNDTTGYKKYQDAIEGLKDVAAHGRTNTVMLQKLNQQKAAEVLPWKQQQIQDFIDAQKKGTQQNYWKQVDPYQQLHSFSIDPILALHKTGTSSSLSPDGLTTYDNVYSDYDATRKNAANTFLNQGEPAQDMSEWFNQVEGYDPSQKQKLIDSVNQRLNDYNTARGLGPDDQGFAPPVKTVTDQDGGLHLADPITDFNAKYALAQQQSYLTKTPGKFNDKLAKFGLDKQRLSLDAIYKNAMAQAANKKANAYVDNMRSLIRSRAGTEDQDQALDELYQRNLLQQPTLIEGKGNHKIILADIKADNSLPLFTLRGKTPELLVPIGGKPVYDKYDNADDPKKRTPSKGAKVVYYEGGHFTPTYIMGDRKVGAKEINNIYLKFKKAAGDNWNGGFDDFIKEAVKSGKFKFLLKGANGTTDEALSRAAQRIISNVNTKKGQEGVFEPPPTDDQVPDVQQPTEQPQ